MFYLPLCILYVTAKMSFDQECLESSDLSDLNETQKKTLSDWEKKFIAVRKYGSCYIFYAFFCLMSEIISSQIMIPSAIVFVQLSCLSSGSLPMGLYIYYIYIHIYIHIYTYVYTYNIVGVSVSSRTSSIPYPPTPNHEEPTTSTSHQVFSLISYLTPVIPGRYPVVGRIVSE